MADQGWPVQHFQLASPTSPSLSSINTTSILLSTGLLYATFWHRRAIVFHFCYFHLYFLFLISLYFHFIGRVGPAILVFHFGLLVDFIFYLILLFILFYWAIMLSLRLKGWASATPTPSLIKRILTSSCLDLECTLTPWTHQEVTMPGSKTFQLYFN